MKTNLQKLIKMIKKNENKSEKINKNEKKI